MLQMGWSIHENIQIGMVRTTFFNPLAYPSHPDSEAELSMMVPKIARGGDAKDSVSIPSEWMYYFKALLEAPAHKKWVKNLLQSEFLELLHMGA
jgi:hypothetical protein